MKKVKYVRRGVWRKKLENRDEKIRGEGIELLNWECRSCLRINRKVLKWVKRVKKIKIKDKEIENRDKVEKIEFESYRINLKLKENKVK